VAANAGDPPPPAAPTLVAHPGLAHTGAEIGLLVLVALLLVTLGLALRSAGHRSGATDAGADLVKGPQ